ncbi:MAG TPA: hypothetical protein ACHBZ9_20220 [Arsenophonus nasoniae]|uniref:hypothetical protein n=1 Tax=Arsenophonus nasoniae TaxID=638 RepID=UPI003879C6E2
MQKRHDPNRLAVFQRCYALKADTLSADLRNEIQVKDTVYIDPVYANRAVRRHIKAAERRRLKKAR